MLNFETLNNSEDLSITLKPSEWCCLLIYFSKIMDNKEITPEDIDIVKTIAPNIYWQFKPLSDKLRGKENSKNRIFSLDDYRRKRTKSISNGYL